MPLVNMALLVALCHLYDYVPTQADQNTTLDIRVRLFVVIAYIWNKISEKKMEVLVMHYASRAVAKYHDDH